MEKMTIINHSFFTAETVVLCGLLALQLFSGTTSAAESGAMNALISQGHETATITEQLDLAIKKLRAGQMMPDAERDHRREAFARYFKSLCQKHGVTDNPKFAEPDQTDFYMNAIKMGLLDRQKYYGWAFHPELSQAVRLELLRRLDQRYDPFLAFCALFPAVKRGEIEYAVGAYEALEQSDPFLAGKVIEWSAEHMGQLDWLATHYLQTGQSEKVRQIIAEASRLGTENALVPVAKLWERLGDLVEAEATCRQVQDEDTQIDLLTAFYARHPQNGDAAGVPFRQQRDTLRDRLFANGLEKVSLADFTAPPRSGMTFTKNSDRLRALGMRAGDVIVALDGYRVQNGAQYVFIRNLDSTNDRMALIVWNGHKFMEVDAWLKDRKFGAPTENYVP